MINFEVKLYIDSVLSDVVKYRSAYSRTAIATRAIVKNNAFSNSNMFVDNTVTLSILDSGDSAYDIALNCNVIEIAWKQDGTSLVEYPWRVIGFITDWEYINDNTVAISYSVDAFSSARSSGAIVEMNGLCERTNLDYTSDRSFINILPEPFGNSDTIRAESGATVSLNEAVYAFEGNRPKPNPLQSSDTKAVLTVSSIVIEYLNSFAWDSPSISFATGLKTRSDLNFITNDTTEHSGGIYRGTPLIFDTIYHAQQFIRTLMSGCGYQSVLPGTGDPLTNTRFATMIENEGGSNVQLTSSTWTSYDIETIRYITSQDIYNLYVIPANFAEERLSYFVSLSNAIELFHDLSNIHGLGPEPTRNAKILSFPFYYGKAVTANGDSINLIPQVYNVRANVWDNMTLLVLDMKYVGGDKPCLMGRFKPEFSTSNAFDLATVGEWFTIRNYPAITLSINNSFNPQIQKEVTQSRQMSALRTTAHANAQLNTPFRQGYVDGINREDLVNNENAGLASSFKYNVGMLAGIPSIKGKGALNDVISQQVQNANLTANASNIISPDTAYFQGNDYVGQLSQQPFSYYVGGAANAEAFSICRYWDMYGQTCNCIINPLLNTGDIWAGLAYVTTVNGRTFYKYSYIDITGAMPQDWRRKIKELFEGGVYLV